MNIFHAITVFFTLMIPAAIAIPSSYTLSSFEKRDAPSSPQDPKPLKLGASPPPDPYESGLPETLFRASKYRAPWVPWVKANEFLYKTIIGVLNTLIEDPEMDWAGGYEFSTQIPEITFRIEDPQETLDSQGLSDLFNYVTLFVPLWQDYGWMPSLDISFNQNVEEHPENTWHCTWIVQNQNTTQKV